MSHRLCSGLAFIAFCLLLAAVLAGCAKRDANDAPAEPIGDITNSIGMKLKLIKPGKFLMGSPKDEEGRRDDEGPQHEVEITSAFYMGVYPVTRGQFAEFVKEAGYSTEAEKKGDIYTWRIQFFSRIYQQTDRDPVVEVSWNDAVEFCQWLSKQEGKTYELPTEAEWEYACRAGTTTAFFFGDDPKQLPDYAWDCHDYGLHTIPVGQRKPNPWGLYDLGGNAQQWCADGYGLYQECSVKDPNCRKNAHSRIARGGGWTDPPSSCRSAYRFSIYNTYHNHSIGFRVVLRPPTKTP